MSILLPQSTAYTFRLGPFLDSTDGNTQENALTIAHTDVLLSKAGGALTAKAETTNLTGTGANAHYTCILGTGDTGTLGALRVWCHVAGALSVYQDFLIVTALIYNSLVAGSDNLQVDTIQWLGTACATPTVNGVPEVDITHWRGEQVSTTTVAGYPKVDTAYIGSTAQTGADLSVAINDIDNFVDTEIANIQSRLPAALTANGNMKCSLMEIISTALTETAGQIAAAFKQFFDVGTPTGTMKAITLVSTCTTNTDMRGTDSAALASVCTEARLSELDAATGGKMANQVDVIEVDTTANLDAAISTRATPAQVNTEVLDVLNTDTFAEPGQEAPGATVSLVKKIGYIYKAFRNKFTQDATTAKLYADDGITVDQKSTESDDATTFTRGEMGTGP